MPTAFLDNQSSTPVSTEVREAMQPFLADQFGNPSSLHRLGLRSRQALDIARAQIAALICAESPEDIIFTSGGTEAVNLAVKGVAWAHSRHGRHLVVSAIEHPAVLNSVEFLEQQGFTSTRVPVDREGFVDPEAVQAALRDDTILVCVQHANHDVGTLQPIRQIADRVSARGIPLFVDAVASAGWSNLDVQALGADLLSLSAHRFYGPKGVGALYRNRRVRLASLIHGGDQERGRRAGTENVPAIVGAGVAAELAGRELEVRTSHVAGLQQRLWTGLRQAVSGVILHGPAPGPGRLGINLNVSAEGTEGEGQLLSLDLAGVAVASGTSCVSKALKVSHVLQAMGVERAVALASILFSLGKDNTEEEVQYALTQYTRVVERLRSLSPAWEDLQRERRAPAADASAKAPGSNHRPI